MHKTRMFVVPLLLLLTQPTAYSAVTKLVVDIPTRPGVTQRILHNAPDAPIAHLILLVGLDGYVGIQPDGSMLFAPPDSDQRIHGWTAGGVSFTVVDTPSDRGPSIDPVFRRSADRATDILAVIRYLQQRAQIPVWVLGMGSGAIDATSVASKLAPDVSLGAILGNPHTVGAGALTWLDLAPIYGPTLVINHAQDACFCCPPGNVEALVGALVNASIAEHVVLVGGDGPAGDPCDDVVGPHAWGGLFPIVVDTIVGWIRKHNALLGNYQGLWWATGGTEAFWGINFAHSGDQVFGTWYTYDTSGKAWWLSMLATRTTPSGNEYTGDINVDVGPPFNNFVGSGTPTKVGTGTLTFSDANNGTFHYDLNAGTGGSPVLVSQTKAIERYNLGTGPQPTCTFSATANLALATNYQDLWWAAEIGWGINFAHQGDSVFLTWYTYDSGGAPLWLSALTQRQGATNVYTGSLLRTSGPRFDNYKASDVVMPIPAVGTATLTFANGNSATFTYTTDGSTGLPVVNSPGQSKSIIRFSFGPGGTKCQ